MAAQLDSMENGELDEHNEEWHPPSEAELKVIEAKRERQDKISKLMGGYLLKGYKMLGSICHVCETILLRTKQGVDYCVACSELDSDATKDDPALSEIAAQRQAQEGQLKEAAFETDRAARTSSSSSAINGIQSRSISGKSSHFHEDVSAKGSNTSANEEKLVAGKVFPTQGSEVRLGEAKEAIMNKMEWATRFLHETQDIDTCVRLCNLIKSCADAVCSLRSVDCRDS